MKSTRTELILLLLLALVLIALEVISAILAYETLGAVASTLYWLAVALNIPLLLSAIRSRTAAAAGILLLALVLVPYQFILAQRWMRVQTEATRVVGYAYDFRSAHGDFPSGLAELPVRDVESGGYIREFRRDPAYGGFVLCYHVGTESTSHCYSPKDGWTYYPD